MRAVFTLAVVLWTQSFTAAATFIGDIRPVFRVYEHLDGTVTTAQNVGRVDFVLSTDYTNIEWEMRFDVTMGIAGGPTLPFETNLHAQGIIATDAPSPLSFPNAAGIASAGTYTLDGTAEWILTKRIVTATAEYESGPQIIDTSQSPPHSFAVPDYPESVDLATNLYQMSLQTGSSYVTGALSLGKLQTNSPSNFIEVVVVFTSSQSTIPMYEVLQGDFNDSGTVDAADYPRWRDGGGLLAPFMTSYGAFASNFGGLVSIESSSTMPVPEPVSHIAILACVLGFIGMGRSQRVFR